MANLTISSVSIVNVWKKETGKAAEALAVGDSVRLEPSTGNYTGANATASPETRARGIVAEDEFGAITIIREGIVDVGEALAALDYDDDVFLSDTDKRLADAAGTVSVIIGKVVPGHASTTADKLLEVKYPG